MISGNTFRHWRIESDENNILWLALDMADSRVNLLNGEVIQELSIILDLINEDLPQGIVIYSAKQDSFIFGADIKEFTTLESDEQAQAFLERGHALMNKLEAMHCPTVSMIHGICLGGGTELSLACDYRVMSDESVSRIGLPEIKLGIHPGYGGTERSIRRMGPLPAMDMMLTGRSLTAYIAKKPGWLMMPCRCVSSNRRHDAMCWMHRMPESCHCCNDWLATHYCGHWWPGRCANRYHAKPVNNTTLLPTT